MIDENFKYRLIAKILLRLSADASVADLNRYLARAPDGFVDTVYSVALQMDFLVDHFEEFIRESKKKASGDR